MGKLRQATPSPFVFHEGYLPSLASIRQVSASKIHSMRLIILLSTIVLLSAVVNALPVILDSADPAQERSPAQIRAHADSADAVAKDQHASELEAIQEKTDISAPADGDNKNLAIIIGCAGGGFALVVLVAGAVYKLWYQKVRSNGHTRLV